MTNGAGFFDKDLVFACWYDQEITQGGLYDEEYVDFIVSTYIWLLLLGVG